MRGGLVGAAVVVLASAAHGWAGGGYPASAALALLLLSAATAGTLAALLPSAGGSRGRLAVLATLGGGQAVAHLALSLLAAHHSDETPCRSGLFAVGSISAGGSMTIAHIVATVVCAVLIVATERFYAALSRTLRSIITRPGALPGAAAARPRTGTRRAWEQLCVGAVGPRAPPVPA